MTESKLLSALYVKYDISNLKLGKIGDKLGDLYEEFVVSILNCDEFLQDFNINKTYNSFEYELFYKILNACELSFSDGIQRIEATSEIPHRSTGGLPKTDVIATVFLSSGECRNYPMSVKQSTVPKVAVAEFDVGTIAAEVGITDPRLIYLLTKHQTDKSAKNFTQVERDDLRTLMKPIAREFVRWAITGSPKKSEDLSFPHYLVKFHLAKESYKLNRYNVFDIDDYVDHIMVGKNGKIKSGGYGTGLSWTYATGSAGKRIQFKA